MSANNKDKEKYSKINIVDDDDEEIQRTLEIPKLFLTGKKKPSKKHDYFDDAIRYDTDENGLNDLQVDERKLHHLYNTHAKTLSKSYLQIILTNVFTFFNILLFSIGIILISIGSFNNVFFLVIVSANLLIGIFQEIKAKQAVDKLSLMTVSKVKVIRSGKEEIIPTDELLLDDVYVLTAGNEIPSDSVIIKGEVEVNESLLTGESLAVKKSKDDYLLAGSYIISGSCLCRCDRIGEHNYVAQLQNKARKVKKVKSVLLTSLNAIIKWISFIILPIGIASFIKNMAITDGQTVSSLTITFGTLIAMIPSGLYLLISTTLTVSVLVLSKKKTMVQDLYSIESLARSNVLCLDKTGTITDGQMILEEEINLTKKNVKGLLGDFLSAFDDKNVTSLALEKNYAPCGKYKVINKIPFSSKRKFSAVEFDKEGVYILGAPEFITKDKNILEKVEEYTNKGQRVLLFVNTKEKLNEDMKLDNIEHVALFVLSDHIREEAKDTIAWFNNNDVEIKIISGDNPVTVSQIAKKVEVPNADNYISLDGLSNEEVIEVANKYTIFGRVSPEQKAILIKAIRDSGKTVAMTGDGVNDILAMKQSNCSIAMASGSDAAIHASHLVLVDSNFASMPKVVEEGRRVINNIQRSATLFLMKTMYAIFIAIFCLLTWTKDPFEANNFYILEFAVIGIPSFALALQPNTSLIKGGFLKNVLSKSLPGGVALILSVLTMLIFNRFSIFDGLNVTDANMATMATIGLSTCGLAVLFDKCRPFNLYRTGLFVLMIIASFVICSMGLITSLHVDKILALNATNWVTLIIVIIVSIVTYKVLDIVITKVIEKNEKTN